ncbi:peptidase A4 family-domain-containing protein [Podospora fimiseda]|uniref:Peptidase A4 family-domain-containing protein n=1 Tax=Podospora fimiseda TaxID=252190 RepID=A0AAN7BWY9_9PEZI|nr:peptidase A4 family-domain-containing protein [Podospora fimiseda]
MRSFVHSLLVTALMLWSTLAELRYTATLKQDGEVVDASHIELVPIPPSSHGKHGFYSPAIRRESNTYNDVSYSDNWCGVAHRSTPTDPVTNVFGYFTAPDLTLRPGIPAPQFAAAWIGVDGAMCNWTMLQAGVTTVVNSNGGQSTSAWWEWYPEASYTISGLTVKPGDWMSVNITIQDERTARVVITNAQRGYAYTLALTSGPKLCRLDTEWILEDFYEKNEQVAFGNFKDVWFQDVAAKTAGGKTINVEGAAMVHLKNRTGTVVCRAEKYDAHNFVIWSPVNS